MRLAGLLALTLILGGCGLEQMGGPAPVVGQTCLGVPAAICGRILADAQRGAPPGSGGVVGIRILCTRVCTEANGEISITVTYGNGQTSESGQGWSSPAEPPPVSTGGPSPVVVPTPPVAPVCVDVPQARCDQQAQEAMSSLRGIDPSSVARILIQCTATCTDTNGDGDAVVTLRDGKRLESSWAYRP